MILSACAVCYTIYMTVLLVVRKKRVGAGGDLVWILYRLQSVLYFSLGMPIGKVSLFFFTAVQPGLKRSLWIALVLDSHNTGLII